VPSTAGSVREERRSLILPGMGVAISIAEGVTRFLVPVNLLVVEELHALITRIAGQRRAALFICIISFGGSGSCNSKKKRTLASRMRSWPNPDSYPLRHSGFGLCQLPSARTPVQISTATA